MRCDGGVAAPTSTHPNPRAGDHLPQPRVFCQRTYLSSNGSAVKCLPTASNEDGLCAETQVAVVTEINVTLDKLLAQNNTVFL